ncbi:MAG: hypothetical protein AAB611_03265, partial [Patescibacteria group bacterium]
MPHTLDKPIPQEQKSQKSPEEHQKEYFTGLENEYQQTISTYGKGRCEEKQRLLTDTFNQLSSRL